MHISREQILREFEVSAGKIVSPGRYAYLPVYAPYYDALAMQGESELHYPQCRHTDDECEQGLCDCVPWSYFKVDAYEHDAWPELTDIDSVWLWEDSQGFLIIKINTDTDALRREYFGIIDERANNA